MNAQRRKEDSSASHLRRKPKKSPFLAIIHPFPIPHPPHPYNPPPLLQNHRCSTFQGFPRSHPEEHQEVLRSQELALVAPLLRAQAPPHPAPPQGVVRCESDRRTNMSREWKESYSGKNDWTD